MGRPTENVRAPTNSAINLGFWADRKAAGQVVPPVIILLEANLLIEKVGQDGSV